VGSAIRRSGVPRGEIFLTTKLWNNSHHPYDVGPALDASLTALGTSYVDLYLMHWPVAWRRGADPHPKDPAGKIATDSSIDFVETYRAMEAQVSSGRARALGVSNFSRKELDRLMWRARIAPAAHQLELHPFLQQADFCGWHRERALTVVAYSPLGNANPVYEKGRGVGKLVEEPALEEIGRAHGASAAQVALAWGVAQGHAVLPKSKTPRRISENLAAGEIKLSAEEVARIGELDRKMRFNDPSAKFGWNFYADLDGKE
jgi:alcohol dehydrogenase (NADP+)